MLDAKTPIIIGADHLGFVLKNTLRDYLSGRGYTVVDAGVTSDAPVDYPDVAAAVARRVSAGEFARAVLVCGTGAGMAIAANKVPGVRAVCINDPYTAERAVASNDAQVVTLGSLVVGAGAAVKLIEIWLASEYQGGRSAPKVDKLRRLDDQYRAGTTRG
jgi:ribose 5-phosphate isomerase B